ncbi:arsenate reductase family protein [Maribacter chungangensis]|uniref:Arsenate reductase family protein n=1 Tax=Maribacter chungangensis TaxID=1069117 RepID=A0ABW3B7L0_9FLAO
MKKIYHLSSCSTCQRIIRELQPLEGFILQDIKTEPITPEQLEEMRKLTDSYASLFSKRAMLFRQRGLHEQNLGEEDYKSLILDHYTFLKRPVIVLDETVFIGNSKKTTALAKEVIHS